MTKNTAKAIIITTIITVRIMSIKRVKIYRGNVEERCHDIRNASKTERNSSN
jgi:hypothetical protein